MKRAMILAAAVALTASPAAAKELDHVKACGNDNCRTVSKGLDDQLLMVGGPTRRPPGGAPFYRVSARFAAPDGATDGPLVRVIFVPSVHMVRTTNETGDLVYYFTTSAAQAALEHVVRGLRPFPARELPRAVVAPPVPSVATPPAPAAKSSDDGVAWWAIAAGAAGLLAGLALLARRWPHVLPWARPAS